MKRLDKRTFLGRAETEPRLERERQAGPGRVLGDLNSKNKQQLPLHLQLEEEAANIFFFFFHLVNPTCLMFIEG